MTQLEPPPDTQRALLQTFVDMAVDASDPDRPITPQGSATEIRAALDLIDLETPADELETMRWLTKFLDETLVHTTNPRYFGLFNPSPTFMGIVADLITAAYNPQLAAWTHAPGPVEIEAHTISFLADRLGVGGAGGAFTTGGSEANTMAVQVALTKHFPEVASGGLRSLRADPTVYVSSESHHSWMKIAHGCGLGRDAIRTLPATDAFTIDTGALEAAITHDRAAGRLPLLVVATAGTTSAGAIDPLRTIRTIANEHDMAMHVDAAWGGAACLSDRLRPHLVGIEEADSITLDAHKWMSVPMGAGVFIVRDSAALGQTYGVSTAYMPEAVAETSDPYTSTIQWSRRFIGLKLFLTLMTVGRTGYAAQLEHDVDLANDLRALLKQNGWSIVNDTPLPVVCFVDPAAPLDESHHQALVDRVLESGRAWISTTRINDMPAIRACITSHRASREDIAELVGLVDGARTTLS